MSNGYVITVLCKIFFAIIISYFYCKSLGCMNAIFVPMLVIASFMSSGSLKIQWPTTNYIFNFRVQRWAKKVQHRNEAFFVFFFDDTFSSGQHN